MAEKKYFWLRLKDNFFDDDPIDWLLEQPKGKDYVILYLRLCLKTLNTGGYLSRKVGDMIIPYDIKKIAEITKTDLDTAMVAFELFQRIGLISIVENKTFYIEQVSRLTGSETEWAEKKRLQRLNTKLLEQGQNEDNVQEKVLIEKEIRDKRLDIEIDKEKEKKNSSSTKVDVDPIISAWNELAKRTIIPPIEKLTNNRMTKIKARIKEFGVDKVLQAISNIEKSDFLKGENERGWVIDFSWFIGADNFVKVLEGKYTTNRSINKSSSTQQVKSKNPHFTNTYSHNWDLEELEKRDRQFLEQKL